MGSIGKGTNGNQTSSAKIANTSESENKTSNQVFEETTELQNLPAGTKIEIYDKYGDRWDTYVAHDQARMGRNGRFLRQRVYSIVVPDKNLGLRTTSTRDPYYIAEGKWRIKK